MSLAVYRRMPCFPNSKPIGGGTGGGGGGVVCDNSTYTNGTTETVVDFIKEGPLYYKSDVAIWDDSSDQQTIAAGWFVEIKITSDIVSAYFINLTSSTTSAEARITLNGGNLNFAGNDDTNTESWFGFINSGYTISEPTILRMEYDGTDFKYIVNGVQKGSNTITLAAGFTYDRIDYGARTPTLSRMEGLYFYANESNVGDADFYSNQSSGLKYFTSKGKEIDLTEDVAGDSQYPYNGVITLDPSLLYTIPETGPLKLNGDFAEVIQNFNIGGASSWTFETYITTGDPNDDNDRLFFCDSTSSAEWYVFYSSALDKFRMFVVNDAGSLVLNQTLGLVVGSKTAMLKVQSVAGIITTTWDGASLPTVDLSSEANINFTGLKYCSQSASFRAFTCTSFNLNFTLIDYWDFVGRLWSLADINGNKFIGLINKTVIELNDDAPTGSVFPYIGAYNTYYLEKDTPCAGNNLVTHNSIAVTQLGEFVFHTP